MVVNSERQPKKMKRRVTAELFNFLTFPADSLLESSSSFGPFRTRVQSFLTAHALLPPPSSLFPHLLTWQVAFRVGDEEEAVVCLDVVEEDVVRSRSVYCDQCRVVGWSGHPVCGKRYHFIIKADGNPIGGYHKPCTCCGDLLHLSESWCKTCNHVTTTDDVEDWVYSQLDNTSHLLHGVVHSNGYGHLLRVNGREGGSRILSGCSIMDFWDRLCKLLAVRKVSVMDVSKKYGLEYRLIHAIAKGYSWYGNWDYKFGTGSFAVTHDAYKAAVELLAGLPLSLFLSRGQNRLEAVISFYQSLSKSKLVCVRDLFSFMISLIHDAHKNSTRVDVISKRRKLFHSASLCSWSGDQIERVEAAMVKVLRSVTVSKWVCWRALRGVACQLASPELLDYCLKDIEGKCVADGKIVASRCNSVTGTFEYRLEQAIFSNGISGPNVPFTVSRLSVQHILADLRYQYEALLHPWTMTDYAPNEMRDLAISSSQKLLDCKQFVKVYKPENVSTASNQFPLCVLCQLELVDQPDDYTTNPPPEFIVLPSSATVLDLKLEASKAFQDVYLMFKRLQVIELLDFGGVDDSTPVKLLLGSADIVRISGRCLSKSGLGQFRMERGVERWTVDCICGARDDDGERMLACDICSVWQHTRCSGIPDSESAPASFVCHKCRSTNQTAKLSGYCKDLAMSYNGSGGGKFGKEFSTLFNVR